MQCLSDILGPDKNDIFHQYAKYLFMYRTDKIEIYFDDRNEMAVYMKQNTNRITSAWELL